MPVRVSPDDPKSNFHIALSDEETDLGLVLCTQRGEPDKFAISRSGLESQSLKISEGNPKHSDFLLPFTPIAQEDWSGGRGHEMFEKNVTRFLDSRRLNTMFEGKAFLGGQEFYTQGHRTHLFNLPGPGVKWLSMMPGDRRYLANHFTTVAGFDAAAAYLLVKRRGTPNGPLIVKICSDSPGDPGAVLKTMELAVDDVPDVLGVLQLFDPEDETLAGATKFWIKVYGHVDDVSEDHWQVGVNATAGTSKESDDDSSWSASGVDLYYRIKNEDDPWVPLFYDYKGQVYMVTAPDDASAAQIFMNGYRGAADSNVGNLARLNDGDQAWDEDELVGTVALITAGPGSLEAEPWRVITSNDASYAVVSPPWKIQHTTATEYVILGLDTWEEIAGSGLTVPVTDLMISRDVIYYALGEDTNIRRHREYNNAGTWTDSDFADDSTNKCTFFKKVNDSADGIELWRGKNDEVKVSKAPPVDWPTNLTFEAGIAVGDPGDKFSSLAEYIDPNYGDKILWCLKRGSVWALKDDKPDMLQLPEMQTVKSEKNGRASLTHGTFLYFSLMNGIERFYNDLLDDVGPTRDRGLPADRQGPCVHMIGYPGKYYAAYDAGPDGYSSILGSGGGKDWHEMYRCSEVGQRIRRLHIQVIPGLGLDRLWFSQGQDILWIPIPSETVDPTQDVAFPYTHEGTLIISRMYVGMQDVLKLWNALKVMADKMEKDVAWIEADYKVDDEDDEWTPFENYFTTSPKQTELFTTVVDPDRPLKGVTGKFAILRLRFQTANTLITPILRATVTRAVSRTPIVHGLGSTIRLRDQDVDLHGIRDDWGLAEEKIAKLDEWANSLKILKLRSISRVFDGMDVFIDDCRLRPYMGNEEGSSAEGYIGTLPITQIVVGEDEPES